MWNDQQLVYVVVVVVVVVVVHVVVVVVVHVVVVVDEMLLMYWISFWISMLSFCLIFPFASLLPFVDVVVRYLFLIVCIGLQFAICMWLKVVS